MRNWIALCLAIGSTSTLSAPAQDAASDPVVRECARSLNTPEKIANMINERFHVVVKNQWPTNFPVPVYPRNVIKKSFSHSTKGQATASATLITADPPKVVFDFYYEACVRANWKVGKPSEKARTDISKGKNDDLFFLTAEQGKQWMFLTFSRNRKNNGTLVSISWQKKS
jgi:hypothetical protein